MTWLTYWVQIRTTIASITCAIISWYSRVSACTTNGTCAIVCTFFTFAIMAQMTEIKAGVTFWSLATISGSHTTAVVTVSTTMTCLSRTVVIFIECKSWTGSTSVYMVYIGVRMSCLIQMELIYVTVIVLSELALTKSSLGTNETFMGTGIY